MLDVDTFTEDSSTTDESDRPIGLLVILEDGAELQVLLSDYH